MRPRKFSGEILDQAEEMRIKGVKWDDVEAKFGYGVKSACYYRKHAGHIASYDGQRETKEALMAWSGLGDKQSFVEGWTHRAKRDRVFS